MITASEVLGQLTELLADVESVRADADNWRTFVGLAEQKGYGPNLGAGLAAGLLPDASYVATAVAHSREVNAAPAAGKSGNGTGRRKITDNDRRIIHNAAAEGIKHAEISKRYGYSKSTVERVLAGVAGAAA